MSNTLKKEVAGIVQEHLRVVTARIEQIEGVLSCEPHIINDLQTQYRIRTQSDGTHYILVRVSEAW